jgi:lipoprotein-anchoring transpeptidase ErfK/SrfK
MRFFSMMRRLLAAVIFAAVSSFVVVPATVAATSPKEQKVLLQKNKKPLAAKKPVVLKVAKPQKPRLVASGERCKGFMQCLFGVKHGVRVTRDKRVVQASLGNTGGNVFARKSRRTVSWSDGKYPVGSLIVKTPERALYYVVGNGEAIRYAVGVGREGFQWSGNSRIVAKAEWPSWTPPAEMIRREAEKGHIIPPFMEGGPGNPLGARALYIGGRIYRVHGTNNEASIGGAVSSGCIRMMNADVIDLYERVKIGAKIYVLQ